MVIYTTVINVIKEGMIYCVYEIDNEQVYSLVDIEGLPIKRRKVLRIRGNVIWNWNLRLSLKVLEFAYWKWYERGMVVNVKNKPKRESNCVKVCK